MAKNNEGPGTLLPNRRTPNTFFPLTPSVCPARLFTLFVFIFPICSYDYGSQVVYSGIDFVTILARKTIINWFHPPFGKFSKLYSAFFVLAGIYFTPSIKQKAFALFTIATIIAF